jgi:hypothetical protein
LTSQIILDSSLSSVLMRGGQFASLGYHYGKGSTALTLHRGGKTSTYHVLVVEEAVSVPLCQWVAIEALIEQGYYGTCRDAVPHEGSTWSAEVVDEVTRWVLEAAVGLVRLERGEGLRQLDGGKKTLAQQLRERQAEMLRQRDLDAVTATALSSQESPDAS